MNTRNEVQTTNQLYQNTRAQLYDVVASCPGAIALSVAAKHELVQWAFLQWVAVNDDWTNTTDRYWERQDPLPFDACLAGEALQQGLASLVVRNNVVLPEPVHGDMSFQDALPFCQTTLATLIAQRMLDMKQGAAPGLQESQNCEANLIA